VHRQPDLLQVVDALSPPGRFAGRLDGGQEQGNQKRYDRDDDQQLDQGESTAAFLSGARRTHGSLRGPDVLDSDDNAPTLHKHGSKMAGL
jgi:hypothetical protein